MNKKILLGSIFIISIIGMTYAETTDLNAIIGTAGAVDYTEDASTMTFSVDYGGGGQYNTVKSVSVYLMAQAQVTK